MSSPQHKRIRPVMHKVERDSPDLNWAPVARPLFSFVESANGGPPVAVRAGESFGLFRPGWERHPLGICTDHYKLGNHVQTDANILEGCAESVTPHPRAMIAGHGYQVAYAYSLKHVDADQIQGDTRMHTLNTGLIVSHDHTGKGAMRASMCLYLDRQPIGSLVYTVASHVADQPALWGQNIEAMLETAIIAQDAIIETIRLAAKRSLSDDDRKYLKEKGLRCPDSVTTALGALVEHHEGRNETMTWGVWERRLSDDGFRAVLGLLGGDLAVTLDEVLHSRRLSCVPRRYSSARKKAA